MEHLHDPRRAYLDFDFRRPWRKSPRLRPLWIVLRETGLFPPRAFAMERTRHGWHVVIDLPRELAPAEMVALQFALGSDRKRETLNLMRALHLRAHPSAFWRARFNILYSEKLPR